MKTIDYLEQLRSAAPKPSVYAVAQLLELPEQTVRNWSKGRAFPDAFACAKIAELLDFPLEQVLADVNAERESDPQKRQYWEHLARKFAACVVMASATTILPSDGHSAGAPGQASGAARNQVAGDRSTNYARLRRALSRTYQAQLRRLLELVAHRFGRFPAFGS